MKASKKQVFISVPMSMDWGTVMKFKQKLLNVGIRVKHWDRIPGSYNQFDLNNSDAVLFLLPKNEFRYAMNELPIGLQTELERVYALSKPLFIGYKTAAGSYSIYNARFNGSKIEGVTGTANDIFKNFCQPDLENPSTEINLPKSTKVYATTIPNPDYTDERLILML